MLLQDKINETIDAIALHYEFKILDKEETGGGHDDREIELQFSKYILKEDLDTVLKDIKDVKYHIVVYSNIAAILVEIGEPHIV